MKPILLIALLGIFFARPAHAYVDPGTGYILWQLILSAVVGGLYSIRKFLKKALRKILPPEA